MKRALILALLLFLFSTRPAFAQSANFDQNAYDECMKNNGEPSTCRAAAGFYNQNFNKVFTPNYFDQIQHSVELLQGNVQNSGWVGSTIGPIPPAMTIWILGTPVLSGGQNGSQVTGFTGGAVNFFASGIELMVNTKPASSIEYVVYMGNKLHVPGTPESAYAAGGGLGFNGLTPVLNIWTVSRNLAYFLFAIIFVVVGLMIMTRRKIDPKTAATIQNALPKIIFALIIVTFSYAIAGFMVDIMYVSLALIVAFMNAVKGGAPIDVDALLSGSIFSFVFSGLWGVALHIGQVTAGIANSIAPLGLGSVPGVNNFVGGVAGGLAMLIVSVAILIAVFRTWFALLGAFANIILAVVFAPLRLTLDAIPGQNQFSTWIKDLLANLMTFPLVTILLAVGAYIASYPTPESTPGFTPPLLGAGTVREVLPFIGLGILLTIPKALDILRETIKAPAFKFGGAWMENINPPGKFALSRGRRVVGERVESIGTEGTIVGNATSGLGKFIKGK